MPSSGAADVDGDVEGANAGRASKMFFGALTATKAPPEDDAATKKARKNEPPIKRRDRALWKRVRCMDLISFTFLLLLFAYVAVVFLNLVFCFEFLQPSDVPFYDPVPASSAPHRQCTRFGMMWWFVAITMLRLVLPIAALRLYPSTIITGGTLLMQLLQMWILIYGLYDAGVSTFFLMSIYIDSKCEDVQLCRGYSGNPDSANWVWLVVGWSGVAYMLFGIVYCCCNKHTISTLREVRLESAAAADAKQN